MIQTNAARAVLLATPILITTAASADVVDLTGLGSTGTVNGALFNQGFFQPAGTGVIQSFVRIQNTNAGQTVEQGYNTSGRPVAFNELTDPNFTRNLTIGELNTVSVNGTDYYEFLLDANEPNAGTRFISLDQVQIFTSENGSQTTTDIASLGTLVYNLDAGADNWIRLDSSLDSGSGEGDMTMLVPVSVFGNAGSNTFVYLYSRFGDNIAANAGFEEWAVRGEVIPTPTAAWLGGGCLAAIGIVRLYRRRHQPILT
jgi:hypothetical protein